MGMGARCKPDRKSAKIVQPAEKSGPAGGPVKFDGRANLGTVSTKAAAKVSHAGDGKPATATRVRWGRCSNTIVSTCCRSR